MAKQTTLPQSPMRGAEPEQQIWTVWTMLRWFINSTFDPLSDGYNSLVARVTSLETRMTAAETNITNLTNSFNTFVAKFAQGTSTVAAGTTTFTVVHNLGLTPNHVSATPNGAFGGTITDLWGAATYTPGSYWISGKTANQFVINLAIPAPAGGILFDWMVKAA